MYHVKVSCHTVTSLHILTNSDGFHGSTAAPIAVGGHNADSVHQIVGHSNHNTCSTEDECTNTWTDGDVVVVDWSPTIILWGLPLQCEGHTVPTILLNSVGKIVGRRGETCGKEHYMYFEKFKASFTLCFAFLLTFSLHLNSIKSA